MNAAVQAATPKKVTIIPCDPQLAERDIRKKHLRVAPLLPGVHRQGGAAIQL